MKLTENFYLHEFVQSQTASRHGIDNTPNEQQIINLRRVCGVLELIRAEIGEPIIISSGFRCLELNTAIGGAKSSKHMEGLAADFYINGIQPKEVVEIIRNIVPYRTIIQEFNEWIHLDIEQGRVLRAHKENGHTQYEHI